MYAVGILGIIFVFVYTVDVFVVLMEQCAGRAGHSERLLFCRLEVCSVHASVHLPTHLRQVACRRKFRSFLVACLFLGKRPFRKLFSEFFGFLFCVMARGPYSKIS